MTEAAAAHAISQDGWQMAIEHFRGAITVEVGGAHPTSLVRLAASQERVTVYNRSGGTKKASFPAGRRARSKKLADQNPWLSLHVWVEPSFSRVACGSLRCGALTAGAFPCCG